MFLPRKFVSGSKRAEENSATKELIFFLLYLSLYLSS